MQTYPKYNGSSTSVIILLRCSVDVVAQNEANKVRLSSTPGFDVYVRFPLIVSLCPKKI